MRLIKHRTRVVKDKLVSIVVTPFTNMLKRQFMKPVLLMDYMTDCTGCIWDSCKHLDHCELCACGNLYERSSKYEYDSNSRYRIDLFNLDNLSRAREKAIRRAKYVK